MDEATQSADNSEPVLPLPPGSFGSPLTGETLDFINDPNFADKRYEKYGSVCKTHLFGYPVIMLMGATANRFVLTNENKYFLLPFPDNVLGPNSLFQMKTEKEHQRQRKLLMQAFQPRVLTAYVSNMEEITSTYLHKWQRQGKLTWYLELRKYTFELTCKVILGIDAVAASHFNELFEQWIDSISNISGKSTVTGAVRGIYFRQQLLSKIEEIILQRQHQLDSHVDFLGLLLQAQNREGDCFGFLELRDIVLDLIVGAYEPLASRLTSLCLLLAQNPSVLAKAHVEQQQWPREEPLTIEHLDQMHYLNQVVKEVLRVTPSSAIGSARKVIQTCSFNGWKIPQGWLVINRIGLVHQDGNIGAEPKRFNPERFSPENKIQPFNFLPFGSGARECPGKNLVMLTMQLFSALLIREYRWELLSEQDLGLVMFPFTHPRDGLKVNFYSAFCSLEK